MDPLKEIKQFLQTAKKPLIVVLGPTASGKTALSLKIAHAIDGEIISTDSRQIYRKMEISTDALAPHDREGIPHHLLGIAEPDETLTLAEYKEMAQKTIEDIYRRDHVPMLVGGTGLYISSIIEGYNVPLVPPDHQLRGKLQDQAAKKGKESVHQKLQQLDPSAAAAIHPNNLRYVIRAIEIVTARGTKKDTKNKIPYYDVFMVGISWPREKLYERVNLRVDLQVKRGLVEEVKQLIDLGYDQKLPSMSSLGVKEIIPYIKGEMPLAECLEVLKKNTRNYAKRQMTWFRRYANVHWLSPDNDEQKDS